MQTREDLIETMARAIDPDAFETAELDRLAHNHSAWAMLREHYEMCQAKAGKRADCILAAIEAAGARVVPVERTEKMQAAWANAPSSSVDEWAAQLAASPFAPPQQKEARSDD